MELLRFLATLRTPLLDKFFLLITEFGGELVFIAVAVIVFWCISKKDGYLILSVGFLGTVVNQFLKLSFQIVRPWVLDPSFEAVPEAIPDATGFSFPSGHTQNSVGTFGTVAYVFKNSWVKAIALVLCLVVPFSRMYLGVHTPLDVFFSFFFAILVILITKPLMYRAKKQSPATPRQVQRLKEYRESHQIKDEIDWENLTKSEASRIMDKYIFVHGR